MDPVQLTDLIHATRATAIGAAGPQTVCRVCTDSRTLNPGDVFWALRGKQRDGHSFIGEAFRKGAAVCVVERRRANHSGSGSVLEVDDTWQAIGEFARWYRMQRETLVIGVTGSVGKTTTREMLHAVLAARHSGMRSKHNFNNEIGLPLSLLEIRADDEFGVLEMGAARIGDIARLCEIACPEAGVITSIGAAHLESFGSLENIYRGKGELLEALPGHGFAIVCGDDERMRALSQRSRCPVMYAGEQHDNDVRACDVRFAQGRLRFTVDQVQYELAAPARHYLSAALCALGVAREIGMEPQAIAEGFRGFRGPPARCEVQQIGPWTLIDDTYNANPLSMRAACSCLRDWQGRGRRLLVTGDMLELGEATVRCHVELGTWAAEARIDGLLALGIEADHVADGALRAGMSRHRIADCRDLDALLTVLDCWLEPGDVVLVKGSRGMRMERVVQWIREQGVARVGAADRQSPLRAVA